MTFPYNLSDEIYDNGTGPSVIRHYKDEHETTVLVSVTGLNYKRSYEIRLLLFLLLLIFLFY